MNKPTVDVHDLDLHNFFLSVDHYDRFVWPEEIFVYAKESDDDDEEDYLADSEWLSKVFEEWIRHVLHEGKSELFQKPYRF